MKELLLPGHSLTPRQLEVLQLVANGASYKVVAYKLSISVRTVEVHATLIVDRLDAINITHAVAIGIRKGIIQ